MWCGSGGSGENGDGGDSYGSDVGCESGGGGGGGDDNVYRGKAGRIPEPYLIKLYNMIPRT